MNPEIRAFGLSMHGFSIGLGMCKRDVGRKRLRKAVHMVTAM